MKKLNFRLLSGGLLVAGGMLYLMVLGFQGSTVYYLTVEEFFEQHTIEPISAEEGFRLAGSVQPGSIRRNPQTRVTDFTLQGPTPERSLDVSYTGLIPDIFRDGASVVLEGRYNPHARRFQATLLMTSCPSKYESKLKESQQ